MDNQLFCAISEFVKEKLFYYILKNALYFHFLINDHNETHFKIFDFTVHYRTVYKYNIFYT